jgi:hypothetical protein
LSLLPLLIRKFEGWLGQYYAGNFPNLVPVCHGCYGEL